MKRHYDKVIVACCFLLMFCNVGLPSTSFSVYQPYIVALPGIGDSAGSLIVGLRTLVSLICMIFVGRYYRAFDCRLGCSLACVFTTAGLFVFGLAKTLPWFLLAATLSGAGYGLGGMVGITLLVNRWYKSDVGSAIGFAAVGSGVASIVIPTVAEWVIGTFSLTVSFWMEAVMALAVGATIGVLLRNRPEDVGATPHVSSTSAAIVRPDSRNDLEGDKTTAEGHAIATQRGAAPRRAGSGQAGSNLSASEHPGVKISPAAGRKFFLAMAFVGAISVTAATFMSVLFVSEGFDHSFVALMLSIYGICLTFSKILTGKLYDRIGVVRGTVFSFAFAIVGLVFLCLSSLGNPVIALIGSVTYGVGLALGTVALPIWSLDLSTDENRDRIIRQFQVGYAAGSFIFNLVPGFLMDLCGTYVISYAIMVAMAVSALVMILSVYSKYYHVGSHALASR